MTEIVDHCIEGQRVAGGTDRLGDVYNPATGSVIRQTPMATQNNVEEAIAAAKAAYPGWSRTTALKRSRIMAQFKLILEQNIQSIAASISEEHGKVHSDAIGEATRGIEVVEFAMDGPHLLKCEVTDNVGTNVDSHSLRQPLGVMVGITPFNFPAMVPMWMFPVAIACGNTFVLKEEIFGPVLSVVKAKDYNEAVKIIGDHEYGNGVAIIARDGDTAREFANDIEVGMVGVNVPIPVPMAFHSFDGWKNSLFGDHHMYGPEGVRFYTRLNTITTRWPKSGQRAEAEFVMPTMG